jgi:hypothetical protein
MQKTQRIDYTIVPIVGPAVRNSIDYPGPYNDGCQFIEAQIDKSQIREVIFHEPDYRKDFKTENAS